MNTNENQIVVYQPNETVRLDVRLENETVWLNRHQMAQLFGRDIKTIGKHIANALSEELACNSVVSDFATTQSHQNPTVANFATVGTSQGSVVAKFATTAVDGKVYQVEYYSLDVILSVGYRVKSAQGILFRRWANTVLKEYLLRGYSVNARLNQLEYKMDRRFSKYDSDIAELKGKVDFFVQTQTPPLQGVFYNGQFWDARALVLSLVSRAKRSLILIDNWANTEVLDLFKKKREGVRLTIFTSEHYDKKHVPHRKISPADVATFNAQYPKLAIRYNETFHDRFLIIDDKELYLIGASLKDLGLHKTRSHRNSRHQEIGVPPHPVERPVRPFIRVRNWASRPLRLRTGGPRSCAAVWRAAILAATRLPLLRKGPIHFGKSFV